VFVLVSAYQGCGVEAGVGVVRGRMFLGGVRFYCPTATLAVQLDHFLHLAPKLGIPVEMVQFLLKLLLNQKFLAVHHDFHLF